MIEIFLKSPTVLICSSIRYVEKGQIYHTLSKEKPTTVHCVEKKVHVINFVRSASVHDFHWKHHFRCCQFKLHACTDSFAEHPQFYYFSCCYSLFMYSCCFQVIKFEKSTRYLEIHFRCCQHPQFYVSMLLQAIKSEKSNLYNPKITW